MSTCYVIKGKKIDTENICYRLSHAMKIGCIILGHQFVELGKIECTQRYTFSCTHYHCIVIFRQRIEHSERISIITKYGFHQLCKKFLLNAIKYISLDTMGMLLNGFWVLVTHLFSQSLSLSTLHNMLIIENLCSMMSCT